MASFRQHSTRDSQVPVEASGRFGLQFLATPVMGCLVLVLALASMGFSASQSDGNRVSGQGIPAPNELTIWSVKRPVQVDVEFDRSAGAPNIPGEALEQVLSEINSNPGRLLTLNFTGAPLQFNGLDRDTRTQLLRKSGPGIAEKYDRYMARRVHGFISEIRKRKSTTSLAVRGLPFEGRHRGAVQANERYADVLADLDAFVSNSSILVGRSSHEASLVYRAYPESLRLAGSRALIYRANNEWRMIWNRGDEPGDGPLTKDDADALLSGIQQESGVESSRGNVASPLLKPAENPISLGKRESAAGSGSLSSANAGSITAAGSASGSTTGGASGGGGGGGGLVQGLPGIGGGGSGAGGGGGSTIDDDVIEDDGIDEADVDVEDDAEAEGETESDNDAVTESDDTDADSDDVGSDSDGAGPDNDDAGSDNDDVGSDNDDAGFDSDDAGSDNDDAGSDNDDAESDNDDAGSDSDDADADGDDAGSDEGNESGDGQSDDGWDPADEIDDQAEEDQGDSQSEEGGDSEGGSDEESPEDDPEEQTDDPGDGDEHGNDDDGAQDDQGGDGSDDWPISEEWEPLATLQAIIDSASNGAVIDLEGRQFALWPQESSSNKLLNRNKSLEIRNARISGARVLDWYSIGGGRYAADVIEDDLRDPIAYMVDSNSEAQPLLAVWPPPPDVRTEFRTTFNSNWIDIRVETDGIDNGDVLTTEGVNIHNANVTGFTITDSEILQQVNDAIGSCPDQNLMALIHSGANHIDEAQVLSWDPDTGVMMVDGSQTFRGYLRFALTGNPDFIRGPREYSIDRTNLRVIYHPENDDPTGARYSTMPILFMVSGQGDVHFENIEFTGVTRLGGGDGLLKISVSHPDTVTATNCVFHSGSDGIRGMNGDVINCRFDRFYGYALSSKDGIKVEGSFFGPALEQHSAIQVTGSNGRHEEIEQTVIRDSYFSLPTSTHGQGMALYMNSWQNCIVEHNIFHNCIRAFSFQPGGSDPSIDTGEFIFRNNLAVFDKVYGELPGGQQGFSFNGRVDEHLVGVSSPQIVLIQSNTFMLHPELVDVPNVATPLKFDVRKLENSHVYVENNIYMTANASVDEGSQLPHNRSHNGAYKTASTHREAWGATDLPDVGGISEIFDIENLIPIGAYATGASDGGPLGIRWSSVPTLLELADLQPNWFEIYQPESVPESSSWSEVFAGEDLR